MEDSKRTALGVNLSGGVRGAAPSHEGGWPVRTGGGGECDAEVASVTSEEQRSTPSLEELPNEGASPPPHGGRAPCAACSPPGLPGLPGLPGWVARVGCPGCPGCPGGLRAVLDNDANIPQEYW